MAGARECGERREARRLVLVIAVLLLLGLLAAVLLAPMLAEFHQLQLAPGVGMKDAAVMAFGASVAVFLVFALAAGDGLIGELQFMLLGFFAFFLVLWVLIGWIF